MNSTFWFLLGFWLAAAIALPIVVLLMQSAARIVRRKQAVIEFLSRELSKERQMRDVIYSGPADTARCLFESIKHSCEYCDFETHGSIGVVRGMMSNGGIERIERN